jgi:hypothetical protein
VKRYIVDRLPELGCATIFFVLGILLAVFVFSDHIAEEGLRKRVRHIDAEIVDGSPQRGSKPVSKFVYQSGWNLTLRYTDDKGRIHMADWFLPEDPSAASLRAILDKMPRRPGTPDVLKQVGPSGKVRIAYDPARPERPLSEYEYRRRTSMFSRTCSVSSSRRGTRSNAVTLTTCKIL